VARGNPKAKAAMKLSRSANISLKEAWQRVKGGARAAVREVRVVRGKARRAVARATATGGKHVSGAPAQIVGTVIRKAFRIATDPFKVGTLLIAAREYSIIGPEGQSMISGLKAGNPVEFELSNLASRLPFQADSHSPTGGTGSRFWNTVGGAGALYVAKKLFTVFMR